MLRSWASFPFRNGIGIGTRKWKKWAVSTETQNSYLGGIHYARGAIRDLARRHGGVRRRACQCQRRTQQDGARPEGMGNAGGRLCQYALFEAQSDQRVQRRQAAGGVD